MGYDSWKGKATSQILKVHDFTIRGIDERHPVATVVEPSLFKPDRIPLGLFDGALWSSGQPLCLDDGESFPPMVQYVIGRSMLCRILLDGPRRYGGGFTVMLDGSPSCVLEGLRD